MKSKFAGNKIENNLRQITKDMSKEMNMTKENQEKDLEIKLKEQQYNSLEELLAEMDKCRFCQEKFGHEPRPVSFGHPHAKIMHISQAPSKKVHAIGRPFSDLSGDRLRNDWYKISKEQFYNPDYFYFTTVGHCFPGKGPKGGDKKPPKCCYEFWTSKEIELMDSAELYLVVGGEAASRIFPKRKLSELIMEDLELNGKPCFVLPHPSPLNMNYFRDHPEFIEQRIPLIRNKIHDIIGLNQDKPETEILQF